MKTKAPPFQSQVNLHSILEEAYLKAMGLSPCSHNVTMGQSCVHPADEFDAMTARGYKLNLITGKYYLA